ncbi:HlyD family secretion protein [Wohlfahrtiimonas chitiniclastica]|uniref:HlyD family secretion protein n=1 Tax=Wohlfahrtiimonas chitiniclastica TaxID=400946 RepID=UPI001BCD0194|nr:efflux RND transporter periplasmic adaptor subunit [Wohlfahrtiimonas chitiniclastica]MBS7838079.1 efflux RND transporter periplasmic adaptor subunit [Wohlfahrtiimonas chitiniclastica]
MQKMTRTLLGLGALFIALVVVLYLVAHQQKEFVLQGEVEANRVDISVRVQGRAKEVFYDLGDNVKEGDTLVILENPAMIAQQITAEAQYNVAKANRDVAYSTRPEQIEIQKALLASAEDGVTLAKQSFDRVQKAIQKGGVSQQVFDEAKTSYEVALKDKLAAEASLQLAENGASIETKHLADAQVAQAKAALNQVNTDVDTLIVKATANGQVTAKVAEVGQLYNPGTPLYSLIDLTDMWVMFNIREDFLRAAKIGDVFEVEIPALKETVEVKITALNALGQYANWRATKATGEFDLRTFEVRAKPIKNIEALRPGMSVIAKWNTRKAQ